MENAVEAKEINPFYPLEFLGRGINNINRDWSYEKAIRFIKICQTNQRKFKDRNAISVIIRTNQDERKRENYYCYYA